MEEKWIRYRRLFSPFILVGAILISWTVFSENPSTSEAPATQLLNPRLALVKVDVQIQNGDALAAKDQAQLIAFRKALEAALPAEMPADLKEQRIKSALKFVKSFRVVDEVQRGEELKMSFEVEIQDSAFDYPHPQAEPVAPPPSVESPGSSASTPSDEAVFEIVPRSLFNQAELIDQIQTQLKLTISSFKMTRTAIILRLKKSKEPEAILQELKAFIGSKADVNLLQRDWIVPAVPPAAQVTSPATPSVPVVPAPSSPAPAVMDPSNVVVPPQTP